MILAGMATAVACATVCITPTNTETLMEVYGEQREEASEVSAPEPVPTTASGTVWDRLAECESNGEWDYGPHSDWGSGIYHGGLQFHPNTWARYRLPGYPDVAYRATREQQIIVAESILAAHGWGQWPACSRELGLR